MAITAESVPSNERLKVESAAQALQATAFQGSLELDIGNLTAVDPSPTNTAAFKSDPDAACLDLGRQLAQSLVGEIFKLPTADSPVGPVAKLPPPSTTLPREKPYPKAKELTRWQKFAASKGITKKKRSKLVFDEESGEWRRRYGYKRVKDQNEVAVLPAKASDEPGSDPFSELEKAKKQRVEKNQKHQLRNIQEAKGKKTSAIDKLPSTVALSSDLGFEGSRSGQQGIRTANRNKNEVKSASNMASSATASMGKFDKQLDGEKKNIKGKKRQFTGVTDTATEKTALNRTLNRVLSKGKEKVLDVNKAVRNMMTEDYNANRDAKISGGKGSGKGGGSGKGKGKGGKKGGK